MGYKCTYWERNDGLKMLEPIRTCKTFLPFPCQTIGYGLQSSITRCPEFPANNLPSTPEGMHASGSAVILVGSGGRGSGRSGSHAPHLCTQAHYMAHVPHHQKHQDADSWLNSDWTLPGVALADFKSRGDDGVSVAIKLTLFWLQLGC